MRPVLAIGGMASRRVSGPPPSTPLTIFAGANIVYLDARSASDFTLSGALVDAWADLGSVALHATQTSGNRPTRDATGLGGRGSVLFGDTGIGDAANTWLRNTGSFLTGNDVHSIFTVARARSSSNDANAGGYATAGTSGTGTRATSTIGEWTAGQRWYGGDDDVAGLVGTKDTSVHLFAKTWDGTTRTGYRDGSVDGTPQTPGSMSLSAGYLVGAYQDASSATASVEVGAVVLVDVVADAGQLAAMLAWAQSVWGTP